MVGRQRGFYSLLMEVRARAGAYSLTLMPGREAGGQPCCVTLGKPLDLSGSQVPPLQPGNEGKKAD